MEAPKEMYNPKLIAKALTQERLGGKAYLQLCAYGETLMDPLIAEVTELLLHEGHYVAVSHNGTIRKTIDVFCDFVSDLKERLHFFISLQWAELNRLDLLDAYADNIRKIKASQISFSISVTLEDILVPQVDAIKEYCMKEFGTMCHILECRDESKPGIPRMTELPLEKHQEVWGSFESLTFDTQQIHWGKRREEFCYMGETAAYLDFGSGDIWQACSGKKLCNAFDDLDEPIRFCALGKNCQVAHCYLGNILLGLGGVIPEIPYPSFAEQRDRLCADGTTWFTPKVRAFFSQRVSENIVLYSDARKAYIDTVMAVAYGNTPRETEGKIREMVLDRFARLNAKNVQIQGNGPLSGYFLSILSDCDVSVSPLNDGFSEADAILVTDYDDFPNVRDSLMKGGAQQVISVLDVVC
jgi:hypothetical protein